MKNLSVIVLLSISIFSACGGKVRNEQIWNDSVPKHVSSVSLKETTSILTGTTERLYPILTPALLINDNVSWSTSEPTVATVGADGVVYGVASGNAVITVTTVDGGFVSACAVTVSDAPISVSGVTLDASSQTIYLGDFYQLAAGVVPLSATNQNLAWSSSDTAIATVSPSGRVHGVALGTAVITVTTVDGLFTAVCNIKIDPVPVSGISFSSSTAAMYVYDTKTLSVVVSPANAEAPAVTWTSSDSSVATVDISSGLITSLKPGSTVVTATTVDGSFTAACTVTAGVFPVAALKIPGGSLSSESEFRSTAVDSSGNVYAAGYFQGSNFSTSEVTASTATSNVNAVIVKYNSSGVPVGIRSVTSGTSSSTFNSVTVSPDGYIYACGYIGDGSFKFDETLPPIYGVSGTKNPVVVKYAPDGTVVWFKTVDSLNSNAGAFFSCIKTDTSGNIYAVGRILAPGYITFPGYLASFITADTSSLTGEHLLIYKFNSSGEALSCAVAGTGTTVTSYFNSLTIAPDGKVYAAGASTCTASGVLKIDSSTKSINYVGTSVLLVKFSSDLVAAGFSSAESSGGTSECMSIASDSTGIYAAGYMNSSITLSGASIALMGAYLSQSSFIVKYDSGGTLLWQKSVSGNSGSSFNSIAVTANGVFVGGFIANNVSLGFDVSVIATGAYSGGNNGVLVHYTKSGTAVWAKSALTSSSVSSFSDIAADVSGNIYAAGSVFDSTSVNYGMPIDSAVSVSTSGYYSSTMPTAHLIKFR